jgi:hypothetical protein
MSDSVSVTLDMEALSVLGNFEMISVSSSVTLI